MVMSSFHTARGSIRALDMVAAITAVDVVHVLTLERMSSITPKQCTTNLAASLRFTVDLTDGFRTGRENGIVFLDSETTGLQKVWRSFGDAAIYGMAEMAPARGGKTSASPPFTDTVGRDCVHPDGSLHCAPHQGQCTSAAPLAHSCISGPRVFHRA